MGISDLPLDAVIDLLAQHLLFEMERMDPSEDRDWEAMDDDGRDFYRGAISALLDRSDLLQSAIESYRSGARL